MGDLVTKPLPISTSPPSPIPAVTWPNAVTAVAPADHLRRTKRRDPIHVAVAAMDAILPVAYGLQNLDGLIANIMLYGDRWIFWIWWCEGPIASIDSVTLNDRPLNDVSKHGIPAEVTNYLGGTDNFVDSQLVAAYAAQSPSIAFAETLPDVAHSVIRVKLRDMSAMPKFAAKVHGRKVYDPRADSTNGGSGSQRLADASTWAFSNNPSLILADFLKAPSSTYGCGMTLDWPSVIAAADANDALLGTSPNQEKSRVCDLLMSQPATIKDWKETLRTAAGCFIAEDQNVARLIPDVAGSPVAAYAHDAGNIVSISSPEFPVTSQLPTVIDVQYTDTTKTPWTDNTTAPVYRPGADVGTIPWRRSTIPMPWIQSRSQAQREAVERMNKLWLRGFTFTAELFGEGLLHRVGDPLTIDYPEHGLDVLPIKVAGATVTDRGTWMILCQKEDAGAYSSDVQANPTTPNTQLPVPVAPPVPTGLTWVEELYTDALGKVKSRMRAAWDDMSAYAYFAGYRIEVYAGAVLMGEPTLSQIPELAWGPVQEGLSYSIDVYTLSPVASSEPAQATATAEGKLAKPGDVPYFFIYEAAGEVRFSWIPALDLDLTAHEIRYGPVGSATWATAALLERIPAPARSYTTRGIAPGSYRFFIKGLDSIRSAAYPNGQESVNAATFDLVVGGDPSVFIAGNFALAVDTLTNVVAFMIGADTRWVTDYGTTVASAFPSTPLDSTYPNIMATYSGSGTSTLQTAVVDFGALYSGALICTLAHSMLAGSATLYIDTSPDNSNWTANAGAAVQVAGFRYARVRLTGTGKFLVTALGNLQLSVVAVTEAGEVTTSASGAVTVTLSKQYTAVKTIQLTADVSGGAPVNPGYLSVNLAANPSTFDVKAWNQATTPALVAVAVKWVFQGI